MAMAMTENKIYKNNKGTYKMTDAFINSAMDNSTPTRTDWSVEEIKKLLRENDVFVIRSLLKLYSFQTEVEKKVKSTNGINGVGFNAYDSKALTEIVKVCIANKMLSNGQVEYVRKKLLKYSKQIMKIANGNIVLA